MEQNKTGKYFKYAIGEIVLVVIGILIALSINNWNEERKLEETTKVILQQIQLDILSNMGIAKNAYSEYNKRDSVFWTMRQKKLTPSDFAGDKGRTYRRTINTFWDFQMINKGFDQLKEHPGIKPGEYAELINDLEWLEDNIKYFNQIEQSIIERREDLVEFTRKNFEWYSSELWTGKISDAELAFYSYDPMVKNYISQNTYMMFNALRNAEDYTFKAVEAYRAIAEILNQREDELPDEIHNYYADIPMDSLKAFTGSYVLYQAPYLNTRDRVSMLDSLAISIEAGNRLKIKKYVSENIFENDLSIKSINKLEEISLEARVHYSINENGHLQIKDIIGLPYLFKKIRD